MEKYVVKAWDWSKNTDGYWRIPCMEMPYLAENWASKGFKSFLDIGCGLGRNTFYMSSRGFEVTAADLSDYAVNSVKKEAEERGLKVTALIADALKLPFSDCSFDCIMAYHSVYHTDTAGMKKVISELKRVLKPNGELFISFLSKNTDSFLNLPASRRLDGNTALKDEYEAGKNVPHFYADLNDLKRLLKEFEFVMFPKEVCEYDVDKTESFSKHFFTIVRKPL